MLGSERTVLCGRVYRTLSIGLLFLLALAIHAQTDPGPRGGAAGAGGAIAGLTNKEGKFFADGQTRFAEVETVANGLGPRFNFTSCAGCHAFPASGGTSPANLFSDLLVHNMGVLGDGISQGKAGPNEFRTAPLWGLGQRNFFLHDGRTGDLLAAIEAHANNGTDTGSEANTVIQSFDALTASQKQDILNSLRTL